MTRAKKLIEENKKTATANDFPPAMLNNKHTKHSSQDNFLIRCKKGFVGHKTMERLYAIILRQ